MATIKKYIKPQITAISVNNEILCSSQYLSEIVDRCSDSCKLWHICRDRRLYKECRDKQYR